ncbi:hypothetical protein [Frigoribacterium sp. CG_9.8]|uniref:hypothetical protein n=1 Tax=Frigoribacterium sp. CG_9.8 TaxID=2787733 RepID=UPI0018C8E125|nr:hypothetical protein [Frigoribacterium sp. CG_9.8]MBG6106555.1 hypothetical protein [Frigoribacterium sp. CG_9.8]
MKVLIEAAQPATKTATGRWRAILAVPGQGSSGKYSAQVLENYGPVAFPAGMKAYINHDENRDPRDLLGTYPDGASWDPNEGPNGALVSELLPLPRYADFVEEVAPHVALSIFALGKADKEGNITELIAHRTNGVDMVGYGGLEGSSLGDKVSERAMSLLESARTAALADERKEESMTPEEMKALVDKSVAEALAPVLAFVSEQKLAAEAAEAAKAAGTEAEPTITEAIAAYAAASDLVSKADVFPTQETALLAAAAKGDDITAALEDAKKIKAEAITSLTESTNTGGRRVESGSDNESYALGMEWN